MDAQPQWKNCGSSPELPQEETKTSISVIELSILLHQKQANQLEALAFQHGLSAAQMLRQILKAHWGIQNKVDPSAQPIPRNPKGLSPGNEV